MVDWNELPFELLCEIVMRLETIEDLVYFSTVCRLWNHIGSMVKQKFKVKAMPWLLLAEKTEETSDCRRNVFSPANNKVYELKLSETIGCRCWGSVYGWLVTYNYDMELHLLNPLTKATMSLPPVTHFPYKWEPHVSFTTPEDYTDYSDGDPQDMMRSMFIRKAFVFQVAEDDLIVFVIYFLWEKKLAFARPGDQLWTSVEDFRAPSRRKASKLVFDVVHKGGKILILYNDASVGYLDICDLSDPQKLVVKLIKKDRPMILSDLGNLGIKARKYVTAPRRSFLKRFARDELGLYLVDSGGDTFLVLRDRRDINLIRFWQGLDINVPGDDYETFGFEVYRLDCNTKGWSRVYDLGDVALFVGSSVSMSIRGVAAGNWKSNCIYFTDDLSEYWADIAKPPGKDMGVFDLENGKREDIYNGCDKYSRRQPPLWFMPQF